MKKMGKIITKLIDIGVEHYLNHLKPDVYAATAALAFSKAQALEHGTALADVAAFMAAIEHAASISSLTHDLSQLAASETTTRLALKTWRKPREPQAESRAITQPLSLFFKVVSEEQPLGALSQDATALYQRLVDTDESGHYHEALQAARANYTYIYSSAHTSYRYAIEMAARGSFDERRQEEFTKAMTKRLSAELNHEPIEPGFLMALMGSLAVSIISWTLLALGLITLSVGVAGLFVPIVSSVVLGAGVGLTSLIVTGASATALSTSALIWQGVLSNQWQQDNAASRHAIEAIQACDELPTNSIASFSS